MSLNKCIVCAIALSVIYGVIEQLHRRKAGAGGGAQSDTQHTVRAPSALKYGYMTRKLPPLLLALCLTLTACGAPPVSDPPDDAAPESQSSVPAFDFQAEGLPLSELLAQAAADHKDSMTLRITQQDAASYFPNDPDSASLLTDAEVASLLEQRDPVDTVSREDALSDVDLLFRALHAAYGAYYYFGAARFDAAQAAVTDWLSEQERVSVNELGGRLRRELLFMLENDAHAIIWEPTPPEQVRYEYFYAAGWEFGQDDTGYFTEKDGVKWYVDGFSDSRVSLRPTLMADGRVVFAPVLFCTRPTMAGSTVTLRSEAGETAACDLTWTESRALREGNHQVDYKLLQENGLTYISVRDFDNHDWGDVLASYAADAVKARGSTAIIYDLRSNGGGGDEWSNQWVQNYTGIPERIQNPVLFANKNSALAKALYDVRGVGIGARGSFGSFDVSENPGSPRLSNAIPVLILMDDACGSAGESALHYLRMLDNTLVIGSNSAGYQLCGNVGGFSLPCSGIGFQFGSSLDLHGDGTDVDFRGWAPDVWCDPQNVLPAALALLQNAGIADGAACETLNAAITAAYEAQPLPEAETLPEPESADMSGIVLEWQGNFYWPGDQLGGWFTNSYITVYYNGEPTADFTLTSGKKSICKMEKKEKGAGAGKIKVDTHRTGRSDFTVICGDESAVFTWCAH